MKNFCPVCGVELEHLKDNEFRCNSCDMKVTVKPIEDIVEIFPWLDPKEL